MIIGRDWESGATAPKSAPCKQSGHIFVGKYFIYFSSNNPRYNLASELYSPRWEEGLYRLLSDGHCHTFSPENVSLSGLKGQHYLNLGLCLDHFT